MEKVSHIPGIKAVHATITDACRTNRGDDGALEEALRRVSEMYRQCVKGWTVGKGAQIHIALTVERPPLKDDSHETHRH